MRRRHLLDIAILEQDVGADIAVSNPDHFTFEPAVFNFVTG